MDNDKSEEKRKGKKKREWGEDVKNEEMKGWIN